MAKIAATGWRYARSGPLSSVLKIENYELRPTENEAVVQIMSAPLHRVDAAIINGTALGRKRVNINHFPRVAGCEGVGKVTWISKKCTDSLVKVGDMVWVAPLHGTWANAIAVPPTCLHRIDPAYASLAVNASNYLAAQHLLEGYARLRKDQVVIQNGGSSVTSLAVSALARTQGLKVLTAASPSERFADAKGRHAAFGSEVFEYNAKGAREMEKVLGNGRGAALYLNGVGGRFFDYFMRLVAPGGEVVTYGAQNSFGLMLSGSSFISREITMQGFFLPTYLDSLSYQERQTQLDFVLRALALEKFEYPVLTAESLEKLPEVWDELFVRGGRKGVLKLFE
ncbi:unnamed protein product [Phytomonas sp. EM1]|nr:unnamed protein product [Phytomonas sp. EM1]|eukprot:CCW61344.1 unnamed protein product [Phytomonas sp. isolate EM1]